MEVDEVRVDRQQRTELPDFDQQPAVVTKVTALDHRQSDLPVPVLKAPVEPCRPNVGKPDIPEVANSRARLEGSGQDRHVLPDLFERFAVKMIRVIMGNEQEVAGIEPLKGVLRGRKTEPPAVGKRGTRQPWIGGKLEAVGAHQKAGMVQKLHLDTGRTLKARQITATARQLEMNISALNL